MENDTTNNVGPVDIPTQCNQCDKVQPRGTLFLVVGNYPAQTVFFTCEYCWDQSPA